MSLVDRRLRERTIGVLERAGWVIIPQPSTASLLRALASTRECSWLTPSLIVVDSDESSSDLSTGLRALGLVVPIVRVAADGVQLAEAPTLPVIDPTPVPHVAGVLVDAAHVAGASAHAQTA